MPLVLFLFHSCRGHICCPHVMVLSCSWSIPSCLLSHPLATVPGNKTSSHYTPYGYYDLITQVATLGLRLEDELRVGGRECTID